MTPPQKQTILVAGAGQAGGQAVRQLLAEGFAGRIVIAGAESHAPYERPPLSKAVLADPGAEAALAVLTPEEWCDPRIDFRAADPVVTLGARVARLRSGAEIAFDACLIATGGMARALTIPGAGLCRTLRTLDDARALRAGLVPGAQLVVIGGGVIGCEVAASAAGLGCAVTVIEAGPRLMARVLPPEVSEWLELRMAAAGVRVLTGVQPRAVARGGAALSVAVQGRAAVAADVVLAAVGMVPNAGLVPEPMRGPAGGILTDACCRVPGMPGIFALGDVAESPAAQGGAPRRLETWRNADRQARAVARTICGTETPHVETPWMWTDQLGHNIQVVGLWRDGAETVCRGTVGAPGSAVFWLEGGVLCGGALIDAGRDRRFLETLVETGARPKPTDLKNPSIPLKKLSTQKSEAA